MKKQKCSGGKRCRALAGWALAVLAALSLTLFMSGCQNGVDPTLPAEYYGTSWVCLNPDANFEVDDTGSCVGTLIYKDVTLPIEIGLQRGARAAHIFSIEVDGHYAIFSGTYKIIEDRIVISGEWSSFMEKLYHQPYEEGECTLVFERQK